MKARAVASLLRQIPPSSALSSLLPPSLPTMASCLQGGGRAYGLDLDITKAASSSSLSWSLSGRSLQTSSSSSTLSESTNSLPCTISIKGPRAPRKRPNQTYNEAAALLSAIYPNIFPKNSLKGPPTKPNRFYSFEELPVLLPPYPVLEDTSFLLREPAQEKPSLLIELKTTSPVENSCISSTSNGFGEPSSPSRIDDDFDTELSILDEWVGEGIDSIMGNQRQINTTSSTNPNTSEEMNTNYTPQISAYLRSISGLQLGSEFELGFVFRNRWNLQHTALKQRDNDDWWRYPIVPVDEVAPKLNLSLPTKPSLDKKKKKKEKVSLRDLMNNASTTAKAAITTTAATANISRTTNAVLSQEKNKTTGLGLKLNYEGVIKAWSRQGSIFFDGIDSTKYSAEALAKLADIDLLADGNGAVGLREVSLLRYKEKKRTRLFSKKVER